jgi:hypothetical protein
MAGALKLIWSTKTNNPSDPDAIRKFHATEANDVVVVTDDHAEKIDALEANQINSSNPYYGNFNSLSSLQTAFPTGVANAWAIIDATQGVTPQIAFWNTSTPAWEISGATDLIIYVANQAALPSPGVAQRLYVTNDKGNIYLWIGVAYMLVGGAEYVTIAQLNAVKSVEEYFTATEGQTLFTLSNSPANVDVHSGRVKQLLTTDYSLSTNEVTLTEGVPAGTKITVRKHF